MCVFLFLPFEHFGNIQERENRVNGFENPSVDSVRSFDALDNGIPTKRKSKNNKKGNPNNNWKRK